MTRPYCWLVLLIAAVVFSGRVSLGQSADPAHSQPEGWTTMSPRDEIRPEFVYEKSGGKQDQPRFCILADARIGLSGWWQTAIPVTGGRNYRFQIDRRCTNVKSPRRTGVVRILWRDEKGQAVKHQEASTASFLPDVIPNAEADFPRDAEIDADGWQRVSGIYTAPLLQLRR